MQRPVKLLYVDDEPLNRLLFERIFNKKYSVLTAESGFKGLEILASQTDIEVVVSDIRMPEMNGIEFVGKAKALYPHISFFILSAFSANEAIAHAIETQLIVAYFQKPFTLDEIDQAIKKALSDKGISTRQS